MSAKIIEHSKIHDRTFLQGRFPHPHPLLERGGLCQKHEKINNKSNAMKIDGFNRIAIVIFVFIWAAIFSGVFAFGWLNTWGFLLVPSMHPPFADMRTVQGAIESIALGYNPQIFNPGDPWQRSMNYPSVWILIANVFSLQIERNYLIFVGMIVFTYLIACFLLLRKYPSIWLVLALFSGSSLLAVERGNNDLVIFTILYFSVIAPVLLGGALIIFGSILKIYPIFSALSLYKNKLILLIVVVVMALIFIDKIGELKIIKAGTPVSASLSYGAASFSQAIDLKHGITINSWWVNLILIASSFVLLNIRKLTERVASVECEEVTVRLFLTGAALFLGTFIFSSNWDYRLIFLIFCIPYINKIRADSLKILILTLILVASNQMLLFKLIGPMGVELCILSKPLLFILLAWITQLEIIRIYKHSWANKVFQNT